MLKIANLKLSPGFSLEDITTAIAKVLRVNPDTVSDIRILRQSIDARKKDDVHIQLTVCAHVSDEEVLLRRQPKNVSLYRESKYEFPYTGMKAAKQPIVVGSGPAGMFCALALAQAGTPPILMEQGAPVAERVNDVDRFFCTGQLDLFSNIQFGEGGAGTFSDGKLTTGTKDLRQRFILEQYVQAGAPEDILYLAKPHIGTDMLRIVVQSLRRQLEDLGGEVRFHCRLSDIEIKNKKISQAFFTDRDNTFSLQPSALVLATGHSARGIFELLYQKGISLEQKNFAVGVRIEHLQSEIDIAQYGSIADFKNLPASDYKLVHHARNGRSAFTFCVCPGGDVVAAASEHNMVVTNGMSNHARSGANCNGGLLVGITSEDFGSPHPLAGIAFQRKLEQKAYELGGGGYLAPAQLVSDFLHDRPSTQKGQVSPAYRPGVRFTDLCNCLPSYIVETLKEALPAFGRKIRGFDAEDAVLTAVESRSSSPVRILRGEDHQSSIRGLFPCGEGAGYAGGIMSAAADGIRCAEKVLDFIG